jgi:hypothetical protein
MKIILKSSPLMSYSPLETALPSSVSLSLLSASASAASASAATLSGSAAASLSSSESVASASLLSSLSSALEASLTAEGFTGTETLRGTATLTLPDGHQVTATATVQANGLNPGETEKGSHLPNYAIALIAVFGFLALVGAIVGLYFLLAAARKRRRRAYGSSDIDSRADSSRPIMGDDGQPYSDDPMSPEGTVDAQMRERTGGGGGGERSGMALAAIMEGSKGKEEGDVSQEAPFTSDEASRMAERFRSMLRNPDFQSPLDEDGVKRRLTVTSQNSNNSPNEAANELMREELEAQGHNLQKVQERRKPELHD